MIIFPAIDILDGKCVRLIEGDFAAKTVYSEDPVSIACQLESEGAEYLHIVDLDGARLGSLINYNTINSIIKTVNIPVQVGGGIRNIATIYKVLNAGAARVILGSIAVKKPDLIKEACDNYGDKIVCGIDAREGIAMINGWMCSGKTDAKELAEKMQQLGARRIVYTDIAQDGKLAGVNIASTVSLAEKLTIPVIASGGVSCIEDILAIKEKQDCGIEGIIVGKTIYEGKLNLRSAVNAARGLVRNVY